jgi:hypothetical protein
VQLAEAAKLTQAVISRAEDPFYGLTLATIGRIAAGYDLAAIIRLVSFGDLIRYAENLSVGEFADLPTFEEENSSVSKSRSPIQSGKICEANPAQQAELFVTNCDKIRLGEVCK